MAFEVGGSPDRDLSTLTETIPLEIDNHDGATQFLSRSLTNDAVPRSRELPA
jgi:hypothetical protein